MSNEFAALASDFYINQRLNLKMDLPMRRDTVLAMFDRVRREMPSMERFRRYDNELALESRSELAGNYAGGQQWLAIRKRSVRSGTVNPTSPHEGYALHKVVLEASPYFLDISTLDIDHVELLYGFDLAAPGNHDAIVYSALLAGSPLGALVEGRWNACRWSGTAKPDDTSANRPNVPLDCQPLLGVGLTDGLDLQAHVEVKTRTSTRQVRTGEYRDEPISVYMTIRKYGPFGDIRDLCSVLDLLRKGGEELVSSYVAPKLLTPLREAIALG